MGSLHARRPPKLEQGDLRRKSKRGANKSQLKGGGSLRRPHSASGNSIDVPLGGAGVGGNNGGKKFCSLWRIAASVTVVILLTLMFIQLRDILAAKGSSGLRPNQNAETSLNTDAISKPG